MHLRPCHVIAGPLGVGKTTAVIDYVRRHAGLQRVAVLVNDFGQMGLDGAIVGGAVGTGLDSGCEIVTIPGGCICCVAAEGLINGIMKLAQLEDIDRILIEPSGLAMPHQIIDLLRQLQDDGRLEVRPVITMLDASKFHAGWTSEMPYFRNMVDAADILIANRSDLADAGTIEKFRQWADGLYPPKLRFIVTQFGQIPDDVFELAGQPMAAPLPHDHHHEHDVNPDQTGGKCWDASVVFDNESLLGEIKTLTDNGNILRLKSIFNTNKGWQVIEYARGELTNGPTGYRRDSRIDWITKTPANDQLNQKFNLLKILT
jgi:G3E family GTPase